MKLYRGRGLTELFPISKQTRVLDMILMWNSINALTEYELLSDFFNCTKMSMVIIEIQL